MAIGFGLAIIGLAFIMGFFEAMGLGLIMFFGIIDDIGFGLIMGAGLDIELCANAAVPAATTPRATAQAARVALTIASPYRDERDGVVLFLRTANPKPVEAIDRRAERMLYCAQ